MSLRIFSTGFLLLLASCGGPPDSVNPAQPATVQSSEIGTPSDDPIKRVACAIGDAAMAEVCSVDFTPEGATTILTLRQPGGGFRRLRATADGHIVAADGAVPAVVTTKGDYLEVAVGSERYRLPVGRQ